jgi:hypothetical protein
MKLGLARDFPETKFSTVMAKVPAQWDHREQSFGNSSIDGAALRYFPSVTWSPRHHSHAQDSGLAESLPTFWDNTDADSTYHAEQVSTGWDSSPRTLIHDPFGNFGYPWGPSFHGTPEQFGDAMSMALNWTSERCGGGLGCPPVYINAWNEWSEWARHDLISRHLRGIFWLRFTYVTPVVVKK